MDQVTRSSSGGQIVQGSQQRPIAASGHLVGCSTPGVCAVVWCNNDVVGEPETLAGRPSYYDVQGGDAHENMGRVLSGGLRVYTLYSRRWRARRHAGQPILHAVCCSIVVQQWSDTAALHVVFVHV